MNLVLIHTHDTGRWIEPYGYAVATPNLMKLAQAGTIFRQCFSAAPTCSPSRAAMLTGMAAHSCGMLGLAHRGFGLSDPHRHAAALLAAQGYETVLCGIQHEAERAGRLPYTRVISADPIEMDRFTEYDGPAWAAYDRANAAAAVEYLKRATGPFFLSFGLFNTHRPFPPSARPAAAAWVAPPAALADTPECRADALEYKASAAIMDECAGRVLEALAAAGRERDTIVAFTSDHGPAFPGLKCSLTDGGLGVALLLRYPGNPAAGRALDAMVSQLDFLPTVFELMGLPRPDHFQGVSLLPLLEGRAARARTELFAEVTYHAAYEPLRCLRTERYKYIRRFDGPRPVPANLDDCPAKDFLVAAGWLETELPEEELYDLALDPAERVNLAARSASAGRLAELRARLADWMKRTGDPLLDGAVALPPGAFANRRDCLSPASPDYEYGRAEP